MIYLDRRPAYNQTGGSPNLEVRRGSRAGLLAFEKGLRSSQLLNHIVEDTSAVKHCFHGVLSDLFKVVGGRGRSGGDVHQLILIFSRTHCCNCLRLSELWCFSSCMPPATRKIISFELVLTSESKLSSGSMQILQYLSRIPA